MDIIKKQKAVGILKGLKESFNHRKESVIALASNMRAQRDPDIHINKERFKKE